MKTTTETNDPRVFDIRVTEPLTFATVRGNAIAKLANHYGTRTGTPERRYMFSHEAFKMFMDDVRKTE